MKRENEIEKKREIKKKKAVSFFFFLRLTLKCGEIPVRHACDFHLKAV